MRQPPRAVNVDRYVDLGVDEVYLHHVGRDLRDCVHVFGPAGDRDALHAWAERAASAGRDGPPPTTPA